MCVGPQLAVLVVPLPGHGVLLVVGSGRNQEGGVCGVLNAAQFGAGDRDGLYSQRRLLEVVQAKNQGNFPTLALRSSDASRK